MMGLKTLPAALTLIICQSIVIHTTFTNYLTGFRDQKILSVLAYRTTMIKRLLEAETDWHLRCGLPFRSPCLAPTDPNPVSRMADLICLTAQLPSQA